jgi:hypothetical protein
MGTPASISILALFFVLGTARAASAQWALSAFLGSVWNSSADLHAVSRHHGTDLTLKGVSYDDKSFRFPIYYGARVTRFFPRVPWLGLEGEFIHLKAISRPGQVVDVGGRYGGQPVSGPAPLGAFVPHFELSHGLNFALANAVVRVPLSRTGAFGPARRVALSARGGLGPTIPHVEARFHDQVEDEYQLSSLGWQAAAGIEVRLRNSLRAVSEVKWTSTSQGVSIGESKVDGPFRAKHLIVGLAWDIPTGSP